MCDGSEYYLETVGFMADSSTGKSFLINLLLCLTSHDARKYSSRVFRERGYVLEWEATLKKIAVSKGKPHAANLTTIRLSDQVRATPALAQQLSARSTLTSTHLIV